MGKPKKAGVNNLKNYYNVIKTAKNDDEIKDFIVKNIKNLITIHKISSTYKKVTFIYDPSREINRSVLDEVYKYVSVGTKTNTLMVLVSPGGSIEPAYMTSKVCREFSKKFVVVIPRMAKSAATLLSLGADEIHMGIISELGPIDPQIGNLPALGMENALEYIAEVTTKYPGSSEMFAKYLSLSLGLKNLGYSKRVAESAVQYATRLLGDRKVAEKFNANMVAKRLVYEYKDHGFVIDKNEAKLFLGDIIKTDTAEFKFGNDIYKYLEDVQFLLNYFRRRYLSIVGGADDGVVLNEMPENR